MITKAKKNIAERNRMANFRKVRNYDNNSVSAKTNSDIQLVVEVKDRTYNESIQACRLQHLLISDPI